MSEEIISADRAHRKTIIILYVLLACGGLAVVGWVIPWREKYLESLETREALDVIRFALVVIFLSIVPLGVYLFTVGRKMMRYERFPPPGMKVLIDTKVVEGDKVKFRGKVVVVLSPLDSPGSVRSAVQRLYDRSGRQRRGVESRSDMSDKDALIQQIHEAFAKTEYPGDPFLLGSREGCEPYDEVGPFEGKNDWTALDSEFLDAHYGALNFFSTGAFGFFFPLIWSRISRVS